MRGSSFFFLVERVKHTGDRTPRGEPPAQRGLRATRGARYVVSQSEEHAPPEGTMRHVACTHRAGQSPPDRAGRRGNVEPRARTRHQKQPPSVSKEDQPVLPAERASRPSVLQVGIASATHRVAHAERSRAPEAPRGRLGLHVRRGQVRGVVLNAHGAAGLRLMARRPRRQTAQTFP